MHVMCAGGWAARAAPIALALAAALFAARGASASAPLDPRGDDWEGLSELVAMARDALGPDRVLVVDSLAWDHIAPEDALLLIHPVREIDGAEIGAFVRAGGRVALLDDYGSGDDVLAAFGARRVPLPEHPAEMLRSNPSLAIADRVGRGPAGQGGTRVVTNHATGIAGGPLQPFLVVRGGGGDVMVGGVAVVGHGSIVAVGDSSIAMNAMLRYPGNRALASTLVAADGPLFEGGRAAAADAGAPGKLFVLANDFAIAGHFGGSWRDAAEGAAHRTASQAEDDVRHGLTPTEAYVLAVLVGAGVITWAGARAGKPHRPSTPAYVRPIPLRAQGGVAGHSADLAAAGPSAAMVARELKLALQERFATALGLEHSVAPHELVVRVRAAGLLDAEGAHSLAAVLAQLARTEAGHAEPWRVLRRILGRIGEPPIVATARRARSLLAAVDARGHGIERGRT